LAEGVSSKSSAAGATTIDALLAKAEQGDAEAQFNLGNIYTDVDRSVSMGVTINLVKAAKWFRMSASQGHARAQNALGEAYAYGYGVPQNPAEAVKWWRKAAEQGTPKAQYNLGRAYARGYGGLPKDPAEAENWYRKSAYFPALKALYASKDMAKYRQAAEQGDAIAQFKLGDAYARIKDLTQDPAETAEAAKWYRKAADQGDANAQNALGNAYAYGWGVTKDSVEAVKWWRKAAEQDDPVAQYNLGMAYASGAAVPQSFSEAAKWFRKAADLGNSSAQYMLGIVRAGAEVGSKNPSVQRLLGRELTFNQKIVQFCQENLGKKIGTGECYALANQALINTGGQANRPPGAKRHYYKDNPGKRDYVWGRLVLIVEVNPELKISLFSNRADARYLR